MEHENDNIKHSNKILQAVLIGFGLSLVAYLFYYYLNNNKCSNNNDSFTNINKYLNKEKELYDLKNVYQEKELYDLKKELYDLKNMYQEKELYNLKTMYQYKNQENPKPSIQDMNNKEMNEIRQKTFRMQ